MEDNYGNATENNQDSRQEHEDRLFKRRQEVKELLRKGISLKNDCNPGEQTSIRLPIGGIFAPPTDDSPIDIELEAHQSIRIDSEDECKSDNTQKIQPFKIKIEETGRIFLSNEQIAQSIDAIINESVMGSSQEPEASKGVDPKDDIPNSHESITTPIG